MSQIIVARKGNNIETLVLPDAKEKVCEGVEWGDHTFIFTPAYWKTLSWFESDEGNESHRLGNTLAEEIAACLLGGHGIPAEIGIAAFCRIREEGLLKFAPTADEVYQVLSKPFDVGTRKVKYRFARQKSTYLSNALLRLSIDSPPSDELQFRSWLLGFPGIGYKTASWITRNWLDSDRVAIVDIHIQRAGMLMHLYDNALEPSKNYLEMESRFLRLSNGLKVRPSILDALIWREMKSSTNMVLRQIRSSYVH